VPAQKNNKNAEEKQENRHKTMITYRFGRIPAAVFFAAVLVLPGGARAAYCPPFPKVVWWGGLTHHSVTAHVEYRYGGDWKPVIESWQKKLTKLQAIRDKGTTAGIRYESTVNGQYAETRQIKLRGAKLDRYIESVWKRLAVMYCLADQSTAQAQ